MIIFSYFGKDLVDLMVFDDKFNYVYEIYIIIELSRMIDGEVLKEVWNKIYFVDEDDKYFLKDCFFLVFLIYCYIFNVDVRLYLLIFLECYRYVYNIR